MKRERGKEGKGRGKRHDSIQMGEKR